MNGLSTGGNAEEAATASAKAVSGSRMKPTRQSARYGREKRNSTPDSMLVAQITNRGPSSSAGSACKVASP